MTEAYRIIDVVQQPNKEENYWVTVLAGPFMITRILYIKTRGSVQFPRNARGYSVVQMFGRQCKEFKQKIEEKITSIYHTSEEIDVQNNR
jgi:hypothetical protein